MIKKTLRLTQQATITLHKKVKFIYTGYFVNLIYFPDIAIAMFIMTTCIIFTIFQTKCV